MGCVTFVRIHMIIIRTRRDRLVTLLKIQLFWHVIIHICLKINRFIIRIDREEVVILINVIRNQLADIRCNVSIPLRIIYRFMSPRS